MYKIRLYTEWLPNSSNEGKTKFFVAEVIKISDLAFVVVEEVIEKCRNMHKENVLRDARAYIADDVER